MTKYKYFQRHRAVYDIVFLAPSVTTGSGLSMRVLFCWRKSVSLVLSSLSECMHLFIITVKEVISSRELFVRMALPAQILSFLCSIQYKQYFLNKKESTVVMKRPNLVLKSHFHSYRMKKIEFLLSVSRWKKSISLHFNTGLNWMEYQGLFLQHKELFCHSFALPSPKHLKIYRFLYVAFFLRRKHCGVIIINCQVN